MEEKSTPGFTEEEIERVFNVLVSVGLCKGQNLDRLKAFVRQEAKSREITIPDRALGLLSTLALLFTWGGEQEEWGTQLSLLNLHRDLREFVRRNIEKGGTSNFWKAHEKNMLKRDKKQGRSEAVGLKKPEKEKNKKEESAKKKKKKIEPGEKAKKKS